MSTITLSVTELHSIIRRRHFPNTGGDTLSALDEILDLLQCERATGKLIINLSGGNVAGGIQFEETAKLTPQ